MLEELHTGCLLMSAAVEVVPEASLAVARHAAVELRACKHCDGLGYISAVDERGYRTVRPCAGIIREARIERFNHARIPARYHAASLESFTLRAPGHAPVLSALTHYTEGFAPGQKGRCFSGGVGIGKTHLLVGVLRYLTLEKGIPCRYVEFTHLLAELRRSYSENRSESEILGPLAEVPVLAIDELGKGRCNEFELRIVDELISRRYNDSSLTTLFATNYYPSAVLRSRSEGGQVESLADRIGERSESRIYELCEFIFLDGSDQRLAQFRGWPRDSS